MRLRTAVAALFLSVPLFAQPLVIRTLAGSPNGGGFADAFGTSARFSVPRAIAADAAGNLWVADTGNHVIRRVTPAGEVMTVAGLPGVAGFADGTGADARFRFPAGIAVDPTNGSIWISDKDNHVIRRMTLDGTVTTIAGQPGVAGSADAQGTNARFAYPRGLVVDSTGVAFVADTQNQVIRRVTADGIAITFAGRMLSQGSMDGTGDTARFRTPSDLAIDPATGNFYVTDSGNHRIRRVTPAAVVTTFAGSVEGDVDGNGTGARFSAPWGVDVDASGNVYVADHDNSQIRRITPAGVVTTLGTTVFSNPSGVAVAGGAVFVSEGFHHAIRRIDPATAQVTTLAGSIPEAGTANGRGLAARMNVPLSVTSDAAGNVYVGEGRSIRRIAPGGVTTTLVSGLGAVSGLAYGPDGNLYVADAGTARVYRVTTSGVMTAIAGQGGEFRVPWGIAVDPFGSVYVTDIAADKVLLIDSGGTVSTFAGTGVAGSFDGPLASSRFRAPAGIAVDSARNVYVADWGNNAIRKITFATGMVSTLVGVTAGLNGPTGIAADAQGNLYVSDANHVIHRVSPAGALTLVAGLPGTPGNVNGTGTDARLAFPEGLAWTRNGELLIADSFNHAVRIGTVFVGPDRRRVVRF